MEDIAFAEPPELDDELNDETFGQMDDLDSDDGALGEQPPREAPSFFFLLLLSLSLSLSCPLTRPRHGHAAAAQQAGL